jgi:uncharacterized membrane protein
MAKQSKAASRKLARAQSQQTPQQLEEKVVERLIANFRQEFLFSGPLPPPQLLSQYNEAVPNGAERIVAMAETQSQHRRELESKALHTDSRNSLYGIIAAFILGMTTVITGAVVVVKGHSWPGTILGSAGLVGIVYSFIYGTRERRKEREAKARNT